MEQECHWACYLPCQRRDVVMQQQKASIERPRLCTYLGYLSSSLSLCRVFDSANNLIYVVQMHLEGINPKKGEIQHHRQTLESLLGERFQNYICTKCTTKTMKILANMSTCSYVEMRFKIRCCQPVFEILRIVKGYTPLLKLKSCNNKKQRDKILKEMSLG